MPQLYQFRDLIRRYSVPFEVEVTTEGAYNELGEYVEGVTTLEPYRAALIPLSSQVIYQSGGRLDERDRQLIKTGAPLALGSHIRYKGRRYKVETWTEFEDYADFNTYLLKHLSEVGV